MHSHLCRLAIAGLMLVSAAPAQNRSLLSALASSYEKLADYRTEVEITTKDPASGPQSSLRRVVLAASRPKMFYGEVKTFGTRREEIKLGTDGTTVWGIDTRGAKFAQHDGPVEQVDEWVALQSLHERYFLRFAKLESAGTVAEWLGYRDYVEGKTKTRCAVVRLTAGPNDGIEEVYVDLQRQVVLRSVLRKGTAEIVTEWRNLQTKEAVEPALFRFAEPAGMRSTNRITLP